MSMDMDLTILRKATWTLQARGATEPRGEMTVWIPTGLISENASWGGVNAEIPKGKYRAGLCSISWLYRNAILASKKLSRRLFAPPFIIPGKEEDRRFSSSPYQWAADHEDDFAPGSEYVVQWWDHDLEAGFPYKEECEKHNSILALSRRKFAQWAECVDYDGGVFQRPYLWMSAKTIASWLKELTHGEIVSDSRAQTVLREDAEALGLIKARQAYLHEVGKIGYRVLISYGDVRRPMRTPLL